ncbi:hypothetical protein CWI39_0104p0030 [Hamiltosporidium magnivora]|uniref:Uncharacterized protein n=1 Tax=Hamiltosporidium magnivora TaxID=148818 RepID=A0A4Q9LNM2_9MICR|nr:hypothetical protein CWI39_0104p0030 [Hamiltosporidium magnivora]
MKQIIKIKSGTDCQFYFFVNNFLDFKVYQSIKCIKKNEIFFIFESKIIPKIKEIVSDFKKIPHNEKNYEELYDTVSSYLENQLDGHKEMFLTNYKTEEIRKQFFEHVFRTSKNEIYIPDSYFFSYAIKYSVSKLGVCTSFNTLGEVFLKNIEKTGTLENDIIINVLIRQYLNKLSDVNTSKDQKKSEILSEESSALNKTTCIELKMNFKAFLDQQKTRRKETHKKKNLNIYFPFDFNEMYTKFLNHNQTKIFEKIQIKKDSERCNYFSVQTIFTLVKEYFQTDQLTLTHKY